jgi:hypothetical protein
MLLNDSMSNLDKAMKIAGFSGMVISITLALYLIFSVSPPSKNCSVFIFLRFSRRIKLSFVRN